MYADHRDVYRGLVRVQAPRLNSLRRNTREIGLVQPVSSIWGLASGRRKAIVGLVGWFKPASGT